MAAKGNSQVWPIPTTVFAHLLAVALTTLVLVWVLHFREGLAFRTQIKPKIFNIHPLLMIVGIVLIGGEAIMAYKTVPASKKVQKRVHMMLHLLALLVGILGIYAVFKFHQELHIPHLYTLHSWLGIITISLYALQAFLVAKDFGVRPAYLLALLHPDRVLGVITLGVPYTPPGPSTFHKQLPEGFYISRWQEPGRAEADFGRLDAKTVVRNIYILFSRNEIPIAEQNQEIMDLVEPSTPLPPWFSEEDLATYGSLYEKSGFETALQVPYRSVGEEYNIPDPVLKLPALLIMGKEDYTFKFPGVQEYIESGKVKHFAPDLEIIFLLDGTHFIHEQLPDAVNKLILDFLNKHT